MKIEFDWQVGSRDQEPEILAQIVRRRPPKRQRRTWVIVAAAIIIAASSGYFVVRRRYEEAERRAQFQIQSVIDLEASAYARGDRDLFLEQQDTQAPEWYAQQAERISPACLRSPTGETEDSLSGARCQSVLAATIATIDLQGDVAWVEVIEGKDPVRRARFYRQTDQGWVHTAPRDTFWGVAIELTYGNLVFLYHRRDEPYIDPLIEQIAATYDGVCGVLQCSHQDPLTFNFSVNVPPRNLARLQDSTLLLLSPWLSGIPVASTQTPAYVRQAVYAVTYEITVQYLRSLTHRVVTPLEDALIDEYAAWQSTQEPVEAPIVGRVVARNGENALPIILRSVQRIQSLNLLMVQWMRLSATDQPVDYFETLLNIEREALVAGRRKTFLLLQDDTAQEWLSAQEAFYDSTRSDDLRFSPVNVQTVYISGDLARVTLDRPLALSGDQGRVPQGQTVIFRRRDGDWKHAPPPASQAQAPAFTGAVPTVDRFADQAFILTYGVSDSAVPR